MKHSLRLLFLLLLMALPQVAAAQGAEAQPAATDQAPAPYVLSPAFPNPFNPTTTFSLTVHQRQEVRVEVYNMLGQPVRKLFDGVMESNQTREFVFEAGDLPSGIYLYRVAGETFTVTRRVTLLK